MREINNVMTVRPKETTRGSNLIPIPPEDTP